MGGQNGLTVRRPSVERVVHGLFAFRKFGRRHALTGHERNLVDTP
jgi:hypothetical protein